MYKVNNLFRCFISFVFLAFCSQVSADIGGKNVILIHGFNPFQLLSPPSDQGEEDALQYWQTVDTRLRTETGGVSNVIYWPSNKRLTGSGGVISVVKPQIDALLNVGHCANQCVIVTHSTGDLVTRFLLKNKTSIFGSAQASKFRVAAVVDLAGAGGGTELANLGVGVANGVNFAGDVISGLLEFAGFHISLGLNVGIMNDLQTSVARNHATSSFPSIPRLRVSGTGSEFYGFATHPLILGADDSVVPLHSACGAVSASSYDSCFKDVRADGKLTYVRKAPSTSQIYDFHYPLVLSEDLPHNAMQTHKDGYWMTFSTTFESAYRSENSNGVSINFNDYEKREWWDFWQKYRYIRDAQKKSVSELIADSI